MMRVITKTFGTVTEALDFYEAVAWACYVQLPNGEVVPALTRMSHRDMMISLARADGIVRVDLVGVVENLALQEAQDRVYAWAGTYVQGALNDAGWTSEAGFEMLSNVQKHVARAELGEEYESGLPSLIPTELYDAYGVFAGPAREARAAALFP